MNAIWIASGLTFGAGFGVAIGAAIGAATGNVALGTALGVPGGAWAGLCVGITIAVLRSRDAQNEHCPQCGYLKKGLPSGICPECGASIDDAPGDEMFDAAPMNDTTSAREHP